MQDVEDIDLLVMPRWLIPVEPAASVLEAHAVAVHQGRIIAVCPAEEALQRFRAVETRMLYEHVLIPGLVNLHTHAAMNLMRGIADDMPLMRWLQEAIWPIEARWMSPDFVRDGSYLAACEMLRGGITCANEMYFFPDAAAQAFAEAGMRAVLGVTLIEFPTPYAADADDYLAKGFAAREAWREHPLLSFCLAPHAPYTVSNKSFERLIQLAHETQLGVHIHLHETRDEIAQSLSEHGLRPLERLRRLGLLETDLVAVHAVHLEAAEIDLLAAHNASVAHCPSSNMKLASGLAPVSQMLARGLRVGLGSDGAASNNTLDLFQEMRQAALLAKLGSGDASSFPAHRVLQAATLDGAAALRLDHEIGSLRPGKLADMTAISFNTPETQPVFDPASHLVYVADRTNVSDVWVAGEARVRDHRLLQASNIELLRRSRVWQTRLRT